MKATWANSPRQSWPVGNFDKQWKPHGKARSMVDANEAFFKADAAVGACKFRRDELQAETQRKYAQAIFRHAVLIEDLNKLLAER